MRNAFLVSIAVLACAATARADDPPTRAQAEQALKRAVQFFRTQVATHGGFVYLTSGDLKLREAEGTTGADTIWVQPPGTPTVGEAFLDAYEASGDKSCLEAAREAALALVQGQMHSGGWFYRIEFAPAARAAFSYRVDGADPVTAKDRAAATGWETWRTRKYKGNISTLDDDTTPAAVRFLARIDKVLEFKESKIHQAALYALTALHNLQYPNGAWSANFDRFQDQGPDAKLYPPKKATYPETWSRTWTKDFTGCYVTNDNLTANMIRTMLFAWKVYGDERYRRSAEKAGDFLIQAQMPEPQPAWAQQYNRDMQPVWDRAFEPPAISGRESQLLLDALLLLYRDTADKRFLEPIPSAMKYLRQSRLGDGRLARFYELKTNRPIYFTRGGDGRHVLTYEAERLATNYAFIVDSWLDRIDEDFKQLAAADPKALQSVGTKEKLDEGAVRRIIGTQDERGAWVETGRLKHHRLEPASGIIASQTFADNVKLLCRYLADKK